MEVIKDSNSTTGTSFFQRIVAILGYILFFNLFLFHTKGSVEFGLLTIGRFIFLTFIFVSTKNFKKNSSTVLSMLIVLLSLCFGMLLRANIFVQYLLGFIIVATLHVYAYILSSEIPMVRSLLELILAPIYFTYSYISTFFRTIKIIFLGDFKQIGLEKNSSGKNALAQSLIIGFGIGLFVIGILISMFSNADPIFATFVKSIVSVYFLQNFFLRIVLSLILGFSLLPFIILKRKSTFNSPIGFLKKINFVQEMSVVMALVSLVIGIFLAIQWPYVFVKIPFETDLSKFGVATYSEYVRKGFIELLKISLFVYGLIWSGLLILRENQQKGKNILKYIQIVVLGEFFIFLFSIFRRVWLYQAYHGWSIVRLYGSFLLLWIFGISIFLALRHFWQRRWVIGEIVFTIIIIFTLGIFNIESFIVKSHPPTVNGKIDYVYLSRMSSDGYLGWEKAFEYAKEVINKYAAPTSFPLRISRDERRDVAYAGIIIRELLKNQKNLVRNFGTQDELKNYLHSTYEYKGKILSKRFLSNNNPSQKEIIKKYLKHINEDALDYKIMIDAILIPDYVRKYKFNEDGFLSSGEDSFIETPRYYDVNYFNKTLKINKKIADSFIDKFYSWNASSINSYNNTKKNISYAELLQLDEKYFDLHSRISGAPSNERSYDMDISLDSPFLD